MAASVARAVAQIKPALPPAFRHEMTLKLAQMFRRSAPIDPDIQAHSERR
jgi:hypothetical protein